MVVTTVFMFIYQVLWTLAVAAIAPVAVVLGSQRFRERVAPKLPSEKPGEGAIWVHALSVGEVLSSLPLVDSLCEKYPRRAIVFTVTTTKGMAVAREALGEKVTALLFFPMDVWWSFRRVAQWICPGVFLLIETDLWPGLLGYLQRNGVKSILINGRISPRTFRAYRRFPVFVRTVFGLLERCLMQSELDARRLVAVGVDPRTVRAVGNIKFDRHWEPMGEEERNNWLQTLGLRPQDIIWVAGSTHLGEEEIILGTFSRLRSRFPDLRLIIAPRRIEESVAISGAAVKLGLKAVLRTERGGVSPYDVLILNTLGELGRIYGLGRIAFVGGSLVPFGGHNLLEPAGFGCPVLFGPYTHNFVAMSEALEERGAAWRVADGKALIERMTTLLEHRQERERMGALAKRFVQENRGAVGRVLEVVESLLDKQETKGRSH